MSQTNTLVMRLTRMPDAFGGETASSSKLARRTRQTARPRSPFSTISPPRPAAKAADLPAVRVLLADRKSLVRAGFRLLLDATERISVVGEAASGEEPVAVAPRLPPTWRRPSSCSGVSASAYIRAEAQGRRMSPT